ncbi:hypothetical protein [Taibaiella soli]|uniref:Uncharacterized protein n=1 Tax=Taibaiella soli TaxID=1649169 RepID=A0A2W2AS30_9BACT|nr:hypothetical protein [Taibaiella soli]PZF70784.1 hypothetical protein DN068_21725 [Taibaiella soli]
MKLILLMSIAVQLCCATAFSQIRTIGPYTIGKTSLADVIQLKTERGLIINNNYNSLWLDVNDENEFWHGDSVSVISVTNDSLYPDVYLCFYKDTLFEIKVGFPSAELITAIKVKCGSGIKNNKSVMTKCGANAFRNVIKWNDKNTLMYYLDERYFKSGCDVNFFKVLCIKDVKLSKEAEAYSSRTARQNKTKKLNDALDIIK